MFCVKCGAQIPDESTFCNKCGAPQAQPAAAQPAPPAPPGAAPAAPGKDAPEEPVWKGRYSGKAAAHWWVLWILWLVGLAYLYLAFVDPPRRTAVVNYIALGLAVLPALVILWNVAVRKLTVRYRLTTHRFFRERGFISRHIDELELIRVDDVSVHQNILQRIFDVGVVTIISTDATEPRLEVEGIAAPIEVKEKIRGAARQRRSRALYMESL